MDFRKWQAETGTVLVWVVGLIVLGLLMVMGAAATATAISDQRRLALLADAAALNAANAMDFSTFYETGDVADIGWWRSAVRDSILQTIASSPDSVFLESWVARNGTVEVSLSRQWHAPTWLVTDFSLRLRATSVVDIVQMVDG
jgi:hypothetical protein